ncbi:hypothetical protein [Blastopirellula marina]|uniref:Uncharacterized protein n=1 Tax=Blastopirellula marina TaxID=124 RepID=A0A2S8F7U0_9BACT|nr:hypothetical protein [Blastopirellula marina]PQO28227.1 hypothetical protein C5Y98_25350 [Blastopirellula marina]PTL41767.1 hypothetical protein C5Y97_25365 [Blastopirellula marina]
MRRPARKANGDQNAPSLDSFLDVVTNLVGILIILIMVVGVTARDALFDAVAGTPEATKPPALSIPAPEEIVPQPAPEPTGPTLAELKSVADDVAAIQKEILQTQEQTKLAFEERNQLQLFLTSAETALNQKQSELDSSKQQEVAQQRELLEESRQLDALYDQIEGLSKYRPEVKELAHYPTPLAKTVFGKEEHFRLKNGRISYVPMDRLVEGMKNDARSHLDRAKRDGTAVSRIGPMNGYVMEYTLISRSYQTETSMGTATRGGVELKQFILVPESDLLGEPVADALKPGSRFRDIVASLDPTRTTITIWTYPDSYHDYRSVRDDLYQIGFTTAARPLPADYPIGGSPQGERSSSQ